MRKRVITAAVGVVGLVVIGLGVASATIWRADDVLVATATSSTQLVVTDPGVLEVGGDPATVRVTAPGGAPVVLVVGRDYDVDGWVGQDAYTRVTGLASWDALATTPGTPVDPSTGATAEPAPSGTASASPTTTPRASATPSPARSAASARPTPTSTASGQPAAGTSSDDEPVISPDPADSDMWFAQAAGNGSAELVWPNQTGRWSVLVASAGDTTPTVSIAWPRVVTTPWLWPCVVVGSLLVIVAGLLLLRGRAASRPGTWESVHTGTVPVVDGAGTGQALTRRQLREAEQASRRTGQIPRVTTGALPAVPAPSESGAPAGARTDPPTTSASAGAASWGPTSTPTDRLTGRPTGPSADADRSSGAVTGAVAGAAAGATTTSTRATPGGAQPPTAPVSRRSLRGGPPTGQIGTVGPASSAARPDAGADRSAPTAALPTAPGPATSSHATSNAVSNAVSNVGSDPASGQAGRAAGVPARAATPPPTGAAAERARQRPSWLGGGAGPTGSPAQSGGTSPAPARPGADQPARPGADQPGGSSSAATSSGAASPSGAASSGAAPGGWVPGAPSAGPDAAGSPTSHPPHGRPPSWAHPPLPGAPAATWSPTPGASSPGRAASSGATPGSSGSADPSATGDLSAGSRADAWRRAWGLPPTAPTPGDGESAGGQGSRGQHDGDRTDDEGSQR